MSDRMHPIPFETLLDWVFGEYEKENSIFGCNKMFRAKAGAGTPWLGRAPETAVGAAAGPHTQLAQNIVAAYVSGARVFELKTVQILDGEDLPISKPCILAEDEGYNCEWSTELTVPEAQDEYIKAWVLLHVLAKELEFGGADGFLFNMSVGYDLDGIRSQKIDTFLNNMKDASRTEAFLHCKEVLENNLGRFARFTKEDLDAISPCVCNNITVSTMHGCPSSEIERIVLYLIEEKGLNLLLKCNPTLVGYEDARSALDNLGFSYIKFEKESFDNDLQFEDAIPMLRRIRARADELGLFFGVKLTNTFAVKAENGELPDNNMYMSGRTLLPLSLLVASRISREFDGGLPMSYCGGADAKNIVSIRNAGLYPITVCTELLKPGGYGKLAAMASALEETGAAGFSPDADALEELSKTLCANARPNHDVRRKPVPAAPQPKPACRVVCGSCVSVCPNRANIIVLVDGEKQMLHVDGMCNECGNCASFCADKVAPYLEKLTVFCSTEELANSGNAGFAPVDGKDRFLIRWNGEVRELTLTDGDFPTELGKVIDAVRQETPWIIYK